MKRKTIAFSSRHRRLFYAVIFLALAWMTAALWLCLRGLTMPDAPADLAVVFGNSLTVDGKPGPILSSRLQVAASCYQSGACPKFFVSGSIDGPGRDEATAMRDYLLTHGVPDECIVVDRQGDNTLATARNAVSYMRAHDLSRVMLVTQYYHLARARYAFERAGAPQIYGSWPHNFRLMDLYSSWREVPAFVIYRIRLGLNRDAQPVSFRPMLFLFRTIFRQS
jgi:uncharacterized SAM-binding protein YcdF (DUF218 family)